jgi:hypothetical protein
MATAQAVLTPTTDTTPAVVELQAGEFSGAAWHPRFPASNRVEDCVDPFRQSLTLFIEALDAAGASVTITNTYRPPERAYLMHWCWRIVNEGVDPRTVPPMAGVAIIWAHTDSAGAYSASRSVTAARAMVNAYGMQNLGTPPALNTRHSMRVAVDMSISWSGTLTITDAAGQEAAITTTPRSGMNARLRTIGAGFGVIKFVGGDADRPHWSDNGH